jgi:NAD(P)-dependent dehydrogenase (short-subunit alcohol dehydrogenase family)
LPLIGESEEASSDVSSKKVPKWLFSGRSHEKGKALEEELSPNVAFYPADAASASDTEALMNFVVERFGKLDWRHPHRRWKLR